MTAVDLIQIEHHRASCHEFTTPVVERSLRNCTFHRGRRRLDSVAAAGRLRSAAPSPIAQQETDATIAALKPPKRQRPLIAIIGINDATETTDYLMPYGILKRAEIADVVTLATAAGPMTLLSGAQGRAAGDDRGVRCAASRWCGLCHRARDEPRRRSGGAAMDQEPSRPGARSSSGFAPAPRSSATPGCCMTSGRRRTGIRSRSCARIIPRSATSKTAVWWPTTASRRRPESRRRCRCRSR